MTSLRPILILILTMVGCAVEPSTQCYQDVDGDGFGGAPATSLADDCSRPGVVSNADDCDDDSAGSNPGAEEVPYDGADNDCDPATMDDDLDGDGFTLTDDCNDEDADVSPTASEVPYDGTDNDCDPATLDDDLDEDGYPLADDCNDQDDTVNPGVAEVPYDGVDNDCAPSTLDDDLDEDGFLLADDCDDTDSATNPKAAEVPYDGSDNDCDPTTLDNDLDQDGFLLADDCDDLNATVNPSVSESPYDGIDNDCDASTLDDDLDQDGFLLADDCDDQSPAVNPGTNELEYDGVDNDCNASTLDDDLDQDGFLLVDDCDDQNPAVNPSEPEVLDDGIDNDCDPATTDDGCVPPTGLTSLWAFEDDTSDSIGTNDGSAASAAYVDGLVGRALDADPGSQSGPVAVPQGPTLTGLGDYTFHAWINTTATPTTRGTIWSIYRCGGTTCDGWDNNNGAILDSGVVRLAIRDSDADNEIDIIEGQVVVNDGAFHHLAFVRDRTNLEARIYVDGQLDASAPLTFATRLLEFTSDDPLVIGGVRNCGIGAPPGGPCTPEPYVHLFEGLLDEITFAHTALDETEIQAIYDAGAAGYCLP